MKPHSLSSAMRVGLQPGRKQPFKQSCLVQLATGSVAS
jgi:hypothetical protein